MSSDLYTYTAMSTTRKSKQPIASLSASDFPKTSPPKPMRPLTAYHIFFQIEREYIIQTAPGASSDSSIHDNKSYQANVPRRYAQIKLSNDWFAGPGKRAKRKHRKSHGCIGFLELSRVISQRWAELGDIDPETKTFVSGIAKRELDIYKREMKEYEALVGSSTGGIEANVAAVEPVKSAPVKKSKRVAKKASSASNELPALTNPVATNYERSGTLITPPATPPPSEEFLESEFDISNVFVDILPDAAFSNMEDVDYSISFMDNAGHHIPSPAGSVCEERKRSFSEESICDPLFELDLPVESYYENSPKRRRMSGDAVDGELVHITW